MFGDTNLDNYICGDVKFGNCIYNGKTYGKKDISSSIHVLANYILENKKNGSPFVFLYAPNHIKTVISFFSINSLGLIPVLMDPATKRFELKEMAEKTPPSLTIKINTSDENFNYQKEVEFEASNIKAMRLKDLENVCIIKYTAAENGYPQAVMLTKHNILANARAILNCDNMDPNSVCCALAPFHSLYGFQTGLLAPLMAGAATSIEDISNLNNIRSFSNNIEKNRVTNLYSIPVVYYLMAKIPDIKRKLKKVKTLVSGGYKLPENICEKFKEITGKCISEGYGITEASPICAWHRPGDKKKIGMVGRAFSCCNIKIMDDNNVELRIGEIGEVCVKGDNIMKGYYLNPELTKQVIVNKWLRTGDLGRMDKDGYLTVTGLKKRMLNVYGQNVYPSEVEKLISLHCNVKNAYVYGEQNGITGNVIKAKVSLKINDGKSKEQLKLWMGKNIAKYKIPSKIEYN